ncbi:DUF4870 domain-containing protein [Dyella silvatica]|uniref:DUF4870 domain-containing protein n=1 Tax=Dyella silvatica TaxID=2992128 RepID=UPI0022587953|nr:DUF4870 domain-containing protein [Dyella silvatica]
MSTPPESVVPPSSSETPPAPTDAPSAEERQWALFAHLSALAGCLLTGAWFGWGCFIGPLIIWLVKKETMPFVADQAKEALNFNITFAIIGAGLLLLSILTLGLGLLLAIPVGIVVGIAWLVLTIMAAIKANEGERYRYPFTLRLIG